eukprot:7265594-Prymnesium_polylepis.1
MSRESACHIRGGACHIRKERACWWPKRKSCVCASYISRTRSCGGRGASGRVTSGRMWASKAQGACGCHRASKAQGVCGCHRASKAQGACGCHRASKAQGVCDGMASGAAKRPSRRVEVGGSRDAAADLGVERLHGRPPPLAPNVVNLLVGEMREALGADGEKLGEVKDAALPYEGGMGCHIREKLVD